MLGIDAHQPHDFIGLRSQDRQGVFNGLDQLGEFLEVLVVSGFGFHLLPEVLDGIVVWRVGRQLMDNETVLVLLKEFASGFTGVITRSILNEDHCAGNLRKQMQQERLITIALKTRLGSLIN